ncbi:putative cleavage and polyadenylation specificity factor [Plasmodium gaboni]|uniref:Putative cleavage and polyadenylation specificity factor n=1 Tax=Plasmodium gaboni TaxID=647221 RepID=A0A151LVT4_9APIC|nr:putative cleavage and polyadenylation specificity factor [Plasmodium gaboni]KYO03299.1 putative cleavage and polyadenylation specificity factor [Plasmodium gaboni]
MNYYHQTKIIIQVLGAGQTVGRSCVIVELENRKVMFDCGCHLGYKDERKYPNFNLLIRGPDKIDQCQKEDYIDDENEDNVDDENEDNINEENINNINDEYINKINDEIVNNINDENVNNINDENVNNINDEHINDKYKYKDKDSSGPKKNNRDIEKVEENVDEPNFYDNSNTEVNISIVNSSITDKENLINNLKRINEIIDCVIISHFHMDHIGALPFFTEILKYRGIILMSYPTKALSPILLLDSCRVTDMKWEKKNFERQIKMLNEKSDELLNYNINCIKKDPWNINEDNIYNCIDKVIGLQINETFELGDMSITPYYAGHVLGACIFKIQVRNFSVIYTGDYNTIPDKHLGSANIPSLNPEIFISESTYATYVRPTRKASELELCNLVHECVHKGGKVLIPVFAIGRAQELSILLDDYWKKMKINYPIYFGCGLTENANKYYKIYSSWINSSCMSNEKENLFDFVNISPFLNNYLNEKRPMVLFATPGMLHTGLSLKAFKAWAGNPQNLIVLPGYCVQGTVGHKLIMGEKQISLDGTTYIKVLCKIIYLSFSAHADSNGIQQLIKHVSPKNVIFVHGEKNGMQKLAKYISNKHMINSMCPSLGQHCHFDFIKHNINYIYMHKNIHKQILQLKKKIMKYKHNNTHINTTDTQETALYVNENKKKKKKKRKKEYTYVNKKINVPFNAYMFYIPLTHKPYIFLFSKKTLIQYLKRKHIPIIIEHKEEIINSDHLFIYKNEKISNYHKTHNKLNKILKNDKQKNSNPINEHKIKVRNKIIQKKINIQTKYENFENYKNKCFNKYFNHSYVPLKDDNISNNLPKQQRSNVIDHPYTDEQFIGENQNEHIITNMNDLINKNNSNCYHTNQNIDSLSNITIQSPKSDDDDISPISNNDNEESDMSQKKKEPLIKNNTINSDDKSKNQNINEHQINNNNDNNTYEQNILENDSSSNDEQKPFNFVHKKDKVNLPLLNLRFKEIITIAYQTFYNFVLTFFQEIVNTENKDKIDFLGKRVLIKNVKYNDNYFFYLSFHSLRAIHDGQNKLIMQWSYVDDYPNSVIHKFIQCIHKYNQME